MKRIALVLYISIASAILAQTKSGALKKPASDTNAAHTLSRCPLLWNGTENPDCTKSALKDLPGVFVNIEKLDPAAEQAGLEAADIEADLLLKLRSAGVPVLSQLQDLRTPGSPSLYVNVNVGGNVAGDLWPYSIEISLVQHVTLLRDPEARVLGAKTWDVAMVGVVPRANMHNTVRSAAKDLADQFINAYRAANPK